MCRALYLALSIYKVFNVHSNPITDEEVEEQSNFPLFTSLVSGRVHSIIHNSTKTQQTADNGLFLGGFKNLKLSINSENDLLAVFGL